MKAARIIGTGSKRGSISIPNQQVAETWPIQTSDEWIRRVTGIESRCHAGSDETEADYAVLVAEEAIRNAGISIADIGAIIVASSSATRPVPALATDVAIRLDTKCAAYDIKAGCSGFVTALSIANGYVVSGMFKYVLVIGVDFLSRITNFHDRGTCVLFGDGAGAVVVGPVTDEKSQAGLKHFVMGSDGTINDKLFTPTEEDEALALMKKYPKTSAEVGKLWMDGPAVFRFATDALRQMVEELADLLGIGIDAVKWLLSHQANLRIIEYVAGKLGISMDRCPHNVEEVGNPSAASIPILLDEQVKAGLLHPGEVVLLIAFGSGGTKAGCSMIWG